MNRVKKIVLSAFCSLVLLVSVFSIAANAGTNTNTWTRFTQYAQGFTLTGEWQVNSNQQGITSSVIGRTVIRGAGAKAGVRFSNGNDQWGTLRAPGVVASLTAFGTGITALRRLAVW